MQEGHPLTRHRSERASPHNTPFPGSGSEGRGPPSPNPLTYTLFFLPRRQSPGHDRELGWLCILSPCVLPISPKHLRMDVSHLPPRKGQGREATGERKVQVKTGSERQVGEGGGGVPTCSRCAPPSSTIRDAENGGPPQKGARGQGREATWERKVQVKTGS